MLISLVIINNASSQMCRVFKIQGLDAPFNLLYPSEEDEDESSPDIYGLNSKNY